MAKWSPLWQQPMHRLERQALIAQAKVTKPSPRKHGKGYPSRQPFEKPGSRKRTGEVRIEV